jgi:hypothetical protein
VTNATVKNIQWLPVRWVQEIARPDRLKIICALVIGDLNSLIGTPWQTCCWKDPTLCSNLFRHIIQVCFNMRDTPKYTL